MVGTNSMTGDEPEPALPHLDFDEIKRRLEEKRREKAATGKPGKTIIVVHDPPPGKDRPPRVDVYNELWGERR